MWGSSTMWSFFGVGSMEPEAPKPETSNLRTLNLKPNMIFRKLGT